MDRSWSRRPLASAVLIATSAMLGALPAMAGEQYDEVLIIVEINATDGDVGFHALFDGEAWQVARMFDPDGNKIFQEIAIMDERLAEQGLTENFFESAEPVCDPEDAEDEDDRVVTLADFVMRFPAGEYTLKGKTIEGLQLKSTAELTYDLPAAPVIEEEMTFEFDPDMPEMTPVVLSWEPGVDLGEKCHDEDLVTDGTISDPADVEVAGYEVTFEAEDDEALEPNRKVTVQLRGDQTSLMVPTEFLASLWDDLAEDGYLLVKGEVGAKEESGNQTFSEYIFCLYEDTEEDCAFEDE